MGSDTGQANEKPVHKVNIGYAFAIGRYPVTFAEYDVFCQATGRQQPEDEGWGRGRHPVINVFWRDAVDYCEWLSTQTGQTYRLPSEAEWEYACRAGSEGKYCFGNEVERLKEYAWYDKNAGKTHPVGEKQPNPWGLYDMHGNVLEWCQDSWHDDYQGAPSDGGAWLEEIGNRRLLRGGSWGLDADNCRAAFRSGSSFRYDNHGFRVVCLAAART